MPRHIRKSNLVQELFVSENERSAYVKEANDLDIQGMSVEITTVDMQWVQVLAEGWAQPLRGFMRENQYLQVI